MAETETGMRSRITNVGRAYIAHGDNVITCGNPHLNANFTSVASIHLPSMGGVTTRGPSHTNPMTVTTKPDPNDATFTRLFVRLHGGFGFTSCGSVTGTTERFDDIANTQTARTLATARTALVGYSINGFGYSATGFINLLIQHSGLTERFDDVVNAHVARANTTSKSRDAGYSLNGYGFTSCGQIENADGFFVQTGLVERFDDVANTNTVRSDAYSNQLLTGYSLNGYGFTSGGNVFLPGVTDRFNDSSNTHTLRAEISVRQELTGYSLNGYGFTSCGWGEILDFVGTTERFDDVTNTQTARLAATARTNLSGYSLNGFGFTTCGITGGGNTGLTERFDDVANTHTVRTAATARDSPAGYSTNEYFVNFSTMEA